MRKQSLLGLLGLVGICGSAMAAAVAVDARPVTEEKSAVSRIETEVVSPDGDIPGVPVDAIPVVLDPNMTFKHVVVGADGKVVDGPGDDEGAVAGPGEHIIYENNLGIFGINFPSNQPVSDDISTLAPDGCNLTRYKFKTVGRANPAGQGGAYTVTYGLYTNCPLAVGSNNTTRDLVRIPGTEGSIVFPDDGPRTVEHIVSAQTPVALPTNIYLSLRFSRGNCGTVVGSPALKGYSGDIWDFPGFPCNGFLGGFPNLPHASFWAELYGSTGCPAAFAAYKCQKPSGGPALLGTNIQGVDDIQLIVNDCHMIGYEVAVRGVGFYTFDLRRECEAEPIANTVKTFQVNAGAVPLLQVARFTFNPPIVLTTDRLWFGFKSSSSSSGAVLAGITPIIGQTQEDLFLIGEEGCSPIPPTQGVNGAINLAITCAGTQDVGACCDPYLTECDAGPDAGKRCACNKICQGGPNNGICCVAAADCGAPGTCEPFCAAPGSCESVCRQTTELNCPFPPRGQDQRPKWIEGEVCGSDPDPFGGTPCGVAACCHMRPNPADPSELIEDCINMTRNECAAAQPLDKARLWRLGIYCGLGGGERICPRNACLARDGSCYVARTPGPPLEPGCDDPFCCSDICDRGADGAFCCNTDWDQACVDLAEVYCSQAPPNDQCAPDFPVRGLQGALAIPFPGSKATSNIKATENLNDPGFCCNGGTGTCISGTFMGLPCISDQDCGFPHQCSESPEGGDPGAPALATVWFKFTLPLGSCVGGATPGAPCATATQCTGLVCVGGPTPGQPCTINANCGTGGTCPSNGTCNGGTTAGINTCNSNAPALDSVMQVFRANDGSTQTNACNSLSVIGCNDDSPNCGSQEKNSRLCLKNLIPGETYYILLGVKTDVRKGQYNIALSTSCSGGVDAIVNDYCQRATAITDATPNDPLVVPFNLGKACIGGSNAGHICTIPADCPGGNCPTTGGATYECPAALCSPEARNDIWWNYTATCSGEATFSTCGPTNPNTNIAVYEGCTTCPIGSSPGSYLACNQDFNGAGCVEPARVVVPVTQGQCYKVRIADNGGFAVEGNLTITCNSGDCQPNGTPDAQDIANCPPGNPACQDCNNNGRPDFCDIRDDVEDDCQPNQRPDSCDLAGNDCQPNGIPDDCTIDEGCGCSGILGSNPANCLIDARQPHAPNVPGTPTGFNTMQMTFASDCDAAAMAPGDFTVECTAGNSPVLPCPTVSNVNAVGQVVTVNLSSVIPAGYWTCVTHTDSGDQVCVGSLPGDASSNGTTAPADIIDVIDSLNGVRVPLLVPHQCDLDRTGVCTPADIISVIDMLNGVNGFISWNGKNLPACPSP